ncbi:MAG: 50S ribosomal protein L35 [Candidatus Omnitrophica bacterium]|nr:50S ribosomal protein L35 [Candidatus Omnitrophota bacterium]
MPKLKTHKGLKKRSSVTKKGKIKHYKAGRRHILTKKGTKRKRKLGKGTYVSKTMQQEMKRLLPYSM